MSLLIACSFASPNSSEGPSLSGISRSIFQTQSGPIKIMPLGDSITFGYSSLDPQADQGGYRTRLYRRLINELSLDVQFVGSQSSGPADLPQRDNEGHSGYRIDQIAAGVNDWIAKYQPDIILLHIGTNDFVQGQSGDAQYRLSLLIDQISADAPNAKLVVASIIPLNLSGEYNSEIDYYNSNLEQIVYTKANVEGKKVVFANLHDSVQSYANSPDYDPDGIHPSLQGYNKMANAWFDVLSSLNSMPANSGSPITDLQWSFAGQLSGMICTQINEPSDSHTWNDNFLCGTRDWGFRWSYAGPIDGMVCTQFLEPSDPDTWNDNYLCAPQNYGLTWSYAGAIPGLKCIQINEPSDPDTWDDNYLCGSP